MAELEFKEDTHQYFYEGLELFSVTTIIHKYVQPFEEDKVIDQMLKGKETYRGNKIEYLGLNKEQIKKKWKTINKQATEYGTAVHLMAENYILGLPYSNEFPRELKQVYNFFRDSGYKCHQPEMRIFSTKYRVAGTVDLILTKGTTFHVFDWKTNRGKDLSDSFGDQYTQYMKFPVNYLPDLPFWHYALQMSIYRYLLESEERYTLFNSENMGEMAIVHIKEELTFPQIIKVPYLKEEAQKVLQHFFDTTFK
jgi:ATP-dependent exoDNAse (exonuclease V) beta subunit